MENLCLKDILDDFYEKFSSKKCRIETNYSKLSEFIVVFDVLDLHHLLGLHKVTRLKASESIEKVKKEELTIESLIKHSRYSDIKARITNYKFLEEVFYKSVVEVCILEKDIQYQFSGGHDKSLQLLLNKDVDAVASYENVIRKYTKEFPTLKEDVKVIAKSELIPGVTVVASNNLDEETQKKVKQALLEIQNDKETIQILTNLFSITGFEEPNNDAYKAIEKISEKMNIDLNKVK